jgi:hypothetical protein
VIPFHLSLFSSPLIFGVVVMGALVRVFEGREEVGTKEMKKE